MGLVGVQGYWHMVLVGFGGVMDAVGVDCIA